MEVYDTLHQKQEKPCAVALGFFDGVHIGHQAVLKAAADYAQQQKLSPCVFTFSVSSLVEKQGQPVRYIFTDELRMEMFEEQGIQTVYAPSFGEVRRMSGEEFCEKILAELLRAKAVFCGRDFRFGRDAACDVQALEAFGEKYGFTVHVVEDCMTQEFKISSSAVRSYLEHGNVEAVYELLGRPYLISGQVQHGDAVGRTHGVPTINTPFAPGQLVPMHGVYLSRTITDSGVYASLTNIGVKPTFKDKQVPGAETHLLDFEGDLYDQRCIVALFAYMRHEERFDDPEALYAQIGEDIEKARAYFSEEE